MEAKKAVCSFVSSRLNIFFNFIQNIINLNSFLDSFIVGFCKYELLKEKELRNLMNNV